MNRITWGKLLIFVLPGFSAATILLGLAACSGGEDSPEPVGDRTVKNIPIPSPDQYGSLAVSQSGASSGFAIGHDSRSSARAKALSRCSEDGCREVLWFRNACGALAVSADGKIRGVGWSSSENNARKNAIIDCQNMGGQNCHIAVSRDINDHLEMSRCNNLGSSPSAGEALNPEILNPPDFWIPQYGAAAVGKLSSVVGNVPIPFFGSGITPDEAKKNALNSCRSYAMHTNSLFERYHFTCIMGIPSYTNNCGAFAISEPRYSSRRIAGYATGKTIKEAARRAIANCHNNGGSMCRVATNQQSGLGILCADWIRKKMR